jgi:hypothetical protein
MKTQAKKVLIIVSGFIPSTIIGVLRPLAALEKLGEVQLRLRLYNLPALLSSDIDWCDIAVFSRNCEFRDLPALYELKRKGKSVVYDIDDNFEEIPLTNDIGVYHRMFYRLHVVKRFFQYSDVTRVYSERMAQLALRREGQPFLDRSYFDASIVAGAQRAVSNGKIKIAYPTGRLDDPALEEMFYQAVRVILERHPGKVEFHLWRKAVPNQLAGVPGVVLNAGVAGYDKFMLSFFKAGFDIGLAPGIDTPFFHSKTNNKYREFGGCGIAGIYGNFPPYSNTLRHEYNALLVESTSQAWIDAMERLIQSPELRAQIARNGAADVAQNYSFESELTGWRKVLVMAAKGQPSDTKWFPEPRQIPRIGIVEFLPHMVGATGQVAPQRTDRLKSLDAVIQALPHASANYFRNIVEFLNDPSRRGFCCMLYLVDDQDSLADAMQIIPLSNSAIVDLSRYSDDVTAAARRIDEAAAGVPTTLLVDEAQRVVVSALSDLRCRVFSIASDAVEPLMQFSAVGYPAVYLDLIERQVRFSAVYRRGRYARIAAIKGRFATFYRRATTVMKYLGWRLGGRKF